MQTKHIGLGILGIAIVAAAGYVLVSKQPSQAQQPSGTVADAGAPHPTTGGGMPNMQPQTPPDITDAQKAEVAAGAAAHKPSALTFDINGGSFYFVPNAITVKKGDTVTINFHNDGGFHDWTLDEFGVKITHVATGAVGSATFVADKAGTYEYYCSVGHHRDMGQKGTIIVE